MDRVYNLLAQVTITQGQTKGQTCLPLPPLDLAGPVVNNKDRIYLLESAVITWSVVGTLGSGCYGQHHRQWHALS